MLLRKKKRLNGESLLLLDENYGDDRFLYRRKFSLQHDNWSSNGQGFLAVTISHMDISQTPWKLVHHRILLPHPGEHTAERNKAKCDEACRLLGINDTMLLSVVQDTTTSSMNTYNDADFVAQLRCGSRTIELVSKHAVEKTAVQLGLDSIQERLRRARGNKSIAK